MSQLSNARPSLLQLISINMNKTSVVSTSYKVKREMESSSLLFRSDLKWYSEFLMLQEKKCLSSKDRNNRFTCCKFHFVIIS